MYSGVDVYEMEVNGIAVMRRRHDSCLNATQILKVAGVDKGRRTKILEKEIQTGEHEKVQGGYGKYQGTWIKFERGVEVCKQYGVEEINSSMPAWVVGKLRDALNQRMRSIKGSRILVLGIAYKKNVDDMRESPSVLIMEQLRDLGALVDYSDSHVPVFPKMREHKFDLRSVSLTAETIETYDAVLIATDHDGVDYELLQRHARLVVDTRGVYRDQKDNVVKA